MKRFARSFVPLLQTNKIFVPQATLYHSLPTQYSTNSIYKNFAPFVSSQRYFTDAPKPINKTKIIEILKLFKEVTENHELVKTKLNNIHNSDADQITKWQEMMKIIVPVQHKILSHYDYSMEEFKKQLEKIVEEEGKENSEIFSIYKENWLYWVEAVFGVKNVLGAEPKIPKKKMVTLIQNFVDSLTGNNFLREISDVVNSNDSVEDKTIKIVNKAANLHKSIMERYGFLGENGYVECQLSVLLDFFGDEEIAELSSTVSSVVFNYTPMAPKE